MDATWLKWGRYLFAVLMVGVLGWVLLSDVGQIVFANALGIRFVAASVLGTGGLLAASMSWSALAGIPAKQGIATFGATLPLRHLPLGGLGQAFGLAGATQVAGVPTERVVRVTPVFMAATAGGAGIVAGPLLWYGPAPLWLKIFVALAIVGVAVMVWFGVGVLERVTPRRWRMAVNISRAELTRSIAWSVAAALGASSAFWLLAPTDVNLLMVAAGWSAAWLCGFVFVVSPAGLGVREVVLIALFPELDAGTVVATALTHRATTFVGEILLFLGSWSTGESWPRQTEESE